MSGKAQKLKIRLAYYCTGIELQLVSHLTATWYKIRHKFFFLLIYFDLPMLKWAKDKKNHSLKIKNPITALPPHNGYFSVSKLAVVERFDCILRVLVRNVLKH